MFTAESRQRLFILQQATTTQVSSIDGIERLYAFRHNSNLPLITVVALGRDEALTAWRRDARLFATVVLILLLAVAIIGQRLLVDMHRRQMIRFRVNHRIRMNVQNRSIQHLQKRSFVYPLPL